MTTDYLSVFLELKEPASGRGKLWSHCSRTRGLVAVGVVFAEAGEAGWRVS